MIDQKDLMEAVAYMEYTVSFYERTGDPLPQQAQHMRTVLDALTMTMAQVANVVDLMPIQNPELVDAGYAIPATDILEALNKEIP